MDALSFLASVSGAAASRVPVPAGNRIATIDPAYDPTSFPGTLPKVTFDGEPALTAKRYPVLTPYRPVPGDRVLMEPAGTTYVITGALRGSDPGAMSVRMAGAALDTLTDSFGTAAADLSGASLSFNLRRGAMWFASWSCDAANLAGTAGLLAVRLSVGGVDLTVPEAHFAPSNVAAGLRLTVGASASGTIATAGAVAFKLRAYRVGGAVGDFRLYDSHTRLTVVVAE